MPPFFNDTFTEGVTTNLESHTPDTGTSWTRLWATDATTRFLQVLAAGTVRCSGNTGDYGLIYTADETYPSANYEVQFTFVTTFNTITPVYLLARIADQENMYGVRLVLSSGGSNAQLYKKVAGTWSTLGSIVTIADGSVVKLSVNGSAIKVYDDGVEVVSVTDSDLSAAGKAGVAHGGGAELVASTDDTRATSMFDDFSVTDLGGGGGTTTPQAVAGTLTSAGALALQTAKPLVGTVSSAGTLANLTAKALSGTLTSAGAALLQTSKVLAGTLTSSGALTAIKTALVSVGGTLSSAGTLALQSAKALGGTVAPDGALTRSVSKTLSGTLSSAGNVVKLLARALAGTLSSSGTVASQTVTAAPNDTNPAAHPSLVRQVARAVGQAANVVRGTNRKVR
jgi:hypothetical protein